MTHSSRVLLVPLLLGGILVAVGCTTTKPGEVVGTEETGRRQEMETSRSISITDSPSARDKTYTLRVQETPIYRVSYAEKRQKLKKRSPLFGSILGLLGAAGILVGYSAAPECFQKDRLKCTTSEQKTKVRNAKIAMGVGAGAFLVGTLSRRWAKQDTSYSPSGEYILGEEGTRTGRGEPVPLAGETVRIRLGGVAQRYQTDRRGRFTIDPAEDFGLRSVKDPGPRVATAILPDRNHTQSLTLDPRQWMVPYFRLTEAQYRLRDGPSREGSVLAVTRAEDTGEEYRVQDRRDDWVKLEYRESECWGHNGAGTVFWAVPTRIDSDRLPHVTASATFSESSGNKRLDADETARVRVSAENKGEGPAYRVRAYLEPETRPHLSYPQVVEFGRIDAGQSKTKTIHIEADREVASGEVGLTFRFQEANGFAPSPLKLQFETRKFIPPELTVADVGIDDANGNGLIDRGEVVNVTARIRNSSEGRAQGVSARVHFGEDVFPASNTQQSFELGNLGPGEYQDVRFSFYTNQQASALPVTMDLFERYGDFGKTGVELPLNFDRSIDEVTVVDVEGQSETVTVEENLSVDIETNIPATEMDRPDAVAVVIGIRNYAAEGAPDVEYARRDARYVREYLTQTLGFREENVLPRNPDGRMTYAEMRTLIQQKLPSYVKEGTSEVFVYYSGHGAPSSGEDRHAYLIPSDTAPNLVSNANAYRLGQFYEDLGESGAESTTVVLDACFTGQDRSGEMLLRQASPLALSVENPLLATENATGFLASGPEQVANWYPEKKHGMFTYFFLNGLRGEADLNRDRKVTVREMKRYLTDDEEGVPYWSGRVHQREQMPQVVSQNPGQVLVRFDSSSSEN